MPIDERNVMFTDALKKLFGFKPKTETPIPKAEVVAAPIKTETPPPADPAPAVDPHPPIKMGDHNYVWVNGAYEIYVSPEDKEKAKAAYAAAHPAPQLIVGKTKLPNGAIYQGNNMYGLSADAQARVYAEAMSLRKSGADPAKLELIISRLVKRYTFDPDRYPDLQAMVDYYIANKSLPPQ